MVVSSTTTDLVKIGSHLDVRNVAAARTTLNQVIETATGDIVVDMSDMEIIDAAGLGMLTAAHLRCERAGHHLVLRNCSYEIRRVLAMTRLSRILNVERDTRLSA